MIKKICDACGCEIVGIHAPYNLKYKIEKNDHDFYTKYDFCIDCTKKIDNFIERMCMGEK